MGKRKRGLDKSYYMEYWLNRLTNLATNMFEWDNLPQEINKAQMEKDIMLGAFSIFFKDKTLDKYFCLPGALTGVDVYGYPTMARPIPKNGYIFDEYEINKDCVVIYANRTRTSALQFIEDYADKLSDLDIAIKMNTLAMKHPMMLKASEQTKESIDTIMKQYEDSYYVIMSDKSIAVENSIDVLNLKVDSVEILNLQKQKETTLNEFFNVFGISGSVEKRERVVSGEMNAMMQQVGINRQMWLSPREESVKHINEIFGLNISCDSTQINFEDTDQDGEIEQKGQEGKKKKGVKNAR